MKGLARPPSRESLREQVRDSIRSALLDGTLRPGEQIRLSTISDALSVSSTPAREALTHLETEGLVVSQPNRGFFAADITLEEAEAIYPVLGALEGLAVELGGALTPSVVAALREINGSLAAAAKSPKRALELDLRWHTILTSACTNSFVHSLLQSLRTRTERYERAYMRFSGKVPASAAQHEELIEMMESDLARVPAALRAHWNLSLEFIREWLSQSPAGAPR